MNIISYSQEIFKVPQAALINLLVLLLCCTSCHQGSETAAVVIPQIEVDKNALVLHPIEGKWYKEDTPFSGYAVLYFSNGSLAEKIGFYHGKKHGKKRKWYEKGSLRSEALYHANKLDGVAKTWWPNGQISTLSHYVLGVRHGIQKQWYEDGQQSRQMTVVNGAQEGLQQAWRRTGKLYANYEAKNGRIFGLKRSNSCYQLEDGKVLY